MQEFSHSDSENSRYPWYRFYRKRHGIPSLPFSQTPRIRPLCKRHQTEHQEGCSGSIPEVFQLCSFHPLRDVFGPKMGIPSQRDFRIFIDMSKSATGNRHIFSICRLDRQVIIMYYFSGIYDKAVIRDSLT